MMSVSSSNSTTSTGYMEDGDDDDSETNGQRLDNNITIITVITISFLIALVVIITICIIQRHRQKTRWNKRLKVAERRMNAIAQDLKITKELVNL